MLGLLSLALAVQPAPVQLTPAGRWSVDAGQTACIARRTFADAEGNQVNLYINPDVVGPGLLMLVDGPRMGRRPGIAPGTAITLANGTRIERIGLITEVPAQDRFITRITFSRTPDTAPRTTAQVSRFALASESELSDKQRAARQKARFEEVQLDVGARTLFAGDGFTVSYGGGAEHRFDTGNVEPLLEALGNCAGMIAADFEVDPNLPAPHVEAKPYALDVLTDNLRGVEAAGQTIETLNWVDADGDVTRCELILPSGNAALNERFCEALKKDGDYLPARNAAGEPVASIHHLRHSFRAERN